MTGKGVVYRPDSGADTSACMLVATKHNDLTFCYALPMHATMLKELILASLFARRPKCSGDQRCSDQGLGIKASGSRIMYDDGSHTIQTVTVTVR